MTTQRHEWTFDFDTANKILFINADASPLQNMIVVFNLDGTVMYTDMEPTDDAGRYSYQSIGNILKIESRFFPANFIQKFRYEDGSSLKRAFAPMVSCLGKNSRSYDIVYDD